MRKASIVFAFIASIVLIASSAMAYPVNTRPVTPLAGSETPIWQVFDNIGATTYGTDPVNTQSSAAVFTNEGSGGAVATFIIAIAGNAGKNSTGLYQYGNTAFKVPIFSGVTTPTQALVTFFDDGAVSINNGSKIAGFGNVFGFYLSGPGGTFFTEDSLNQDPQALIYQGNGVDMIQAPGFAQGLFSKDEWIIAWEDLPYATTDKDFNDLVYIVESIRPVPEPMTLVLVGAGLLGLGILRRKS